MKLKIRQNLYTLQIQYNSQMRFGIKKTTKKRDFLELILLNLHCQHMYYIGASEEKLSITFIAMKGRL